MTQDFSDRIIAWQRVHGRHDLPWQGTRDPYRVWLSEIMLQQTQVSTVLEYFPRFLARLGDVFALAAASEGEVMALWSGLGYYSRGRNLHRCGQEVVSRFGGEFPRSAEQLQDLPGIGRSTAAAIASFCFGERVAILDGNVKRVLTRYFGISDDMAKQANERALWQRAQDLLPHVELQERMPAYTQGLMDLGATVCKLRRPNCPQCPLSADCVARREGEPERYPVKSRRLKRSQVEMWLLQTVDPKGRVWLPKRPSTGIWGGLNCLPVFSSREELMAHVSRLGQVEVQEHPAFMHVLTHRDLYMHVISTQLEDDALVESGGQGEWFGPGDWGGLGLPAPVRRFLESALTVPA